MDEVMSTGPIDVARAGVPGRSHTRNSLDLSRMAIRLGASAFIGLLLLLLWIALSRTSSPDVLPGPWPVWLSFLGAVRNGTFFPAAGTTAEEALVGWLIAAAFALPLGYAIGRFRLLEDALAPYLAGSQAMPIVAVAPLLLIWVGFGIWSKIWISALIAFFPMLATTASGIRGVPRDLIDAGRVFGATGWGLAQFVYLPLAARAIFSGMKVAAALSVTGAVVGEFIAPEQGLGYLVGLSRQSFDTPLTFVAVIALILMGALAYWAVSVIERLVLRWED
jgi:NitT/TauT family transport system permease protein